MPRSSRLEYNFIRPRIYRVRVPHSAAVPADQDVLNSHASRLSYIGDVVMLDHEEPKLQLLCRAGRRIFQLLLVWQPIHLGRGRDYTDGTMENRKILVLYTRFLPPRRPCFSSFKFLMKFEVVSFVHVTLSSVSLQPSIMQNQRGSPVPNDVNAPLVGDEDLLRDRSFERFWWVERYHGTDDIRRVIYHYLPLSTKNSWKTFVAGAVLLPSSPWQHSKCPFTQVC